MTQILHLHTYFLFPFSIDREAVTEDQSRIWGKYEAWIDGLNEWLAPRHWQGCSPVVDKLGCWQPAPYTKFDMDSPAYQDMVFFHPFVRRVFFHVSDGMGGEESDEALLRSYRIPLEGQRVKFCAEDAQGRHAETDLTDLRLFLFANGIGILSFGVEALRLPLKQALWINEMMRKVYPSSGRQRREGRVPCRTWLSMEREGIEELIVEERYETGAMRGFLPPLSRVVTSLLYFADYERQEFEPVLDERMIVYTYAAIDPANLPPGFKDSKEYSVLLSRFLWVDRDGPGYRYEPEFTREQMDQLLYKRWAHQGTYYGFTSYSNITVTFGTFDCDEHVLREGFLIHRMFDSRYYLMALVALFYRATLLDFAEKNALVSKSLYQNQGGLRLLREDVRQANILRSEFLHFSNYWYFEELANKDEEVEHFALQCRAYRIGPMKCEVEQEIEKLNAMLTQYYQNRNTEAVNRMAMLTVILGAGALMTGFFGMNFGRDFGELFFDPKGAALWSHYAAIAVVSAFAFGALIFGCFVVVSNWSDYREILLPPGLRENANRGQSLKRKGFF